MKQEFSILKELVKSYIAKEYKSLKNKNPELFKDVEKATISNVLPILVKNNGLYNIFLNCKLDLLPITYKIMCDFDEVMNDINMLEQCKNQLTELYNDCKKEQHTFPRAFVCEKILEINHRRK